jgi:hypothetical protein
LEKLGEFASRYGDGTCLWISGLDEDLGGPVAASTLPDPVKNKSCQDDANYGEKRRSCDFWAIAFFLFSR